MRFSRLPRFMSAFPMRRFRPPMRSSRRISRKLKRIIALLTPGLVFAEDGEQFGAAIAACVPEDVEVLVCAHPPGGRNASDFALPRQDGADACRRCRACKNRRRHDRQDSLHLRFDDGAEGGHHHASHAVRQPGDDRRGLALLCAMSRPCWSIGCPGIIVSAAIIISAWRCIMAARSISIRAGRRRPESPRRCGRCGRSRRRSSSMSRRVSRCFSRISRAIGRLLKISSGRCSSISLPAHRYPTRRSRALDEIADSVCGARVAMISGFGATETRLPCCFGRTWRAKRSIAADARPAAARAMS